VWIEVKPEEMDQVPRPLLRIAGEYHLAPQEHDQRHEFPFSFGYFGSQHENALDRKIPFIPDQHPFGHFSLVRPEFYVSFFTGTVISTQLTERAFFLAS
jgi:hypothetical protein